MARPPVIHEAEGAVPAADADDTQMQEVEDKTPETPGVIQPQTEAPTATTNTVTVTAQSKDQQQQQRGRKRQRRQTGPRSRMYLVRRKRRTRDVPIFGQEDADEESALVSFDGLVRRLQKRKEKQQQHQQLSPVAEEPGGGPDGDEVLDEEELHMFQGSGEPEFFAPQTQLRVDVKVRVVKDSGEPVTLEDIAALFHREVSGLKDPVREKHERDSNNGKPREESYEVKLARRAKRQYVVDYLSKLKTELIPCGASFPIPVASSTSAADLWEDHGLRVEVSDSLTPSPQSLCLHQVDWELQLAKRDRERAYLRLSEFKNKEELEAAKTALREAMYRYAVLAYEKRERSIGYFARRRRRWREKVLQEQRRLSERRRRRERKKRASRFWFLPRFIRYLGSSSNRRGVQKNNKLYVCYSISFSSLFTREVGKRKRKKNIMHPTVAILLIAVLIGTATTVLYNQYTSVESSNDEARQSTINDATDLSITEMQSSIADLQSTVSALTSVTSGLTKATSISRTSNQTGVAVGSNVLFNGSFKTSTQCVTYDSTTGAFTLDASSVYLVSISLMVDLFTTDSASTTTDTRWTTFYAFDGASNKLGPSLICQPNTRVNQSNLSSIQTIAVVTGTSSSSRLLQITCSEIGDSSYSFIVRPETNITFVKLGVAPS